MKVTAVIIVVFVLSACGAGSPAPATTDQDESPNPGDVTASTATIERSTPIAAPTTGASAECTQAFGEMLPDLNSQESMESRLSALETCTSLDEWVAAAEQYPDLVQTLVSGAWEEPTASLYLLGEACAFLDAGEGAPLCDQLSAWCESSVDNLSQVPCQVAQPMSR